MEAENLKELVELKLSINKILIKQIFSDDLSNKQILFNVRALYQAMNWVTSAINYDVSDEDMFTEDEMIEMVRKSMPK